jgi:hypothetical protein
LGQVTTLGYESAEVLFEEAVGLVIDDALYEITASHAAKANGMAYCYWLTLQAPAV